MSTKEKEIKLENNDEQILKALSQNINTFEFLPQLAKTVGLSKSETLKSLEKLIELEYVKITEMGVHDAYQVTNAGRPVGLLLNAEYFLRNYETPNRLLLRTILKEIETITNG